MKQLHRMSIHGKLTLALAGSAFAALAIAVAALALFTSLTWESRAKRAMEPYARLVSVGAEAAVRFEDPQRAEDILNTLRADPQILEAAIFLADGRTLASYRRDATGSLAPQSLRPDGVYLNRDTAELSQRLAEDAHLRLLVSLTELNRQTRAVGLMLASGLFVLLVVTALGLRAALQKGIVGPIATLAETVERVRHRGDYRQRVPTFGTDEVSSLGRSFNAMMVAVEERDSALRKLTVFQRTLLDSAASAIVSVTPEGTVSSFNPAAERLLGYTSEEVVGRCDPSLWHDADEVARHARFLSQELGETIQPGFEVFAARPSRNLTEEGEWTVARKDGSRVSVLLSVTALRGESGEITGFLGLFHDLTERRKAEASLREKTEELNRYFTNALDLLCITDADGYFRRLNPAWESTLGYSVDELRGRRFLDLVHPEDREATARVVDRMAAEGALMEFTNRYLSKDGAYRWLEWRAFPSGERIYAVVRDVTERKRAEAALRRLNRELRAISDCNEVLMRAEDEPTLLKDVCRIVCDEAGYRMAWVGYAVDDEAKTVRPVGWAGKEEGYLADARISWGESEFGQGPVGRSIRDGASHCIQDFETDPHASPWRARALALGYRSAISLPLKDEKGAVFGVFVIYSTEPEAFTENEVRLLEELAGDLAFGINVLRSRQERERAEAQLRRSEHGLAQAQRIAQLGNWELDLVNNVLTWSDEIFRIFEIDPTEFGASYEAFLNAIHPEDRQLVNQAYLESLEKKVPYDLVHRLQMPDGRIKYVNEKCETIFADDGKPLLSRGTVHDITERKQVEESLRKSEEKYRTLIQKLQVAVVVHAANTQIVTCNVVAQSLLGLSEDQLRGKAAIDKEWHFFREDGTEMPYEEYPVNQVLARRQPLRNLVVGVHRPGESQDVWALVNANPVFGPETEITEVIVTFIDVTERREAQEKLAHLASIVESSDDAIIGKTLDGMIVSWNRGAERVYGYAAKEIIGRPVSVLIPSHLSGELDRIMEGLKRGERVEHYETTRRRKDGQLIHVALTVSPIKDARGRIIGGSTIARDISERVRAEAEIRQLNADLERRVAERTSQLVEANNELEAFASSVSHDLRAPLRHMDGFMELLLEHAAGSLDEKSREYVNVMSDAAKRMGTLIDDLLAFSRMGRREMLSAQVDLNLLVKDVVQDFARDCSDREIEWRIADLPPVLGDRSMLRIVLQNLISNAIKFTRPRKKATIEIGFDQDGANTVFFVKDNGVGFEYAYVHKLFGVFQRLHREDQFEGTGIGLANVRRVVERHGGKVWAEGNVDHGATFYFRLPKTRS